MDRPRSAGVHPRPTTFRGVVPRRSTELDASIHGNDGARKVHDALCCALCDPEHPKRIDASELRSILGGALGSGREVDVDTALVLAYWRAEKPEGFDTDAAELLDSTVAALLAPTPEQLEEERKIQERRQTEQQDDLRAALRKQERLRALFDVDDRNAQQRRAAQEAEAERREARAAEGVPGAGGVAFAATDESIAAQARRLIEPEPDGDVSTRIRGLCVQQALAERETPASLVRRLRAEGVDPFATEACRLYLHTKGFANHDPAGVHTLRTGPNLVIPRPA